MRIKNRYAVVLILSVGLILTAILNIDASAADDVQEVVEKTAQRVLSYPEMTNWKASALSTMYEMDKKWKPKKACYVPSIVAVLERQKQCILFSMAS